MSPIVWPGGIIPPTPCGGWGYRGDEIGELARSIRVLRDEAQQAMACAMTAGPAAAHAGRTASGPLQMADQFEGSIQQVADA